MKQYSAKTKERYRAWVHQAGLKPLTGNQYKLAMMLIENEDIVGQIGDLRSVFVSVNKFLETN